MIKKLFIAFVLSCSLMSTSRAALVPVAQKTLFDTGIIICNYLIKAGVLLTGLGLVGELAHVEGAAQSTHLGNELLGFDTQKDRGTLIIPSLLSSLPLSWILAGITPVAACIAYKMYKARKKPVRQ